VLKFHFCEGDALQVRVVLIPSSHKFSVRGSGHRRHFLFAPYSNRGNTPAGRLEVRMERLLAARNPNKSQAFPVKEPNGSRIPLDRSSLPGGKACNVLGSKNRVLKRTLDRQR
jgi:hypothetical protein